MMQGALKLALLIVYLSVLVVINFFLPFSMFYRTIYSYESLFNYVESSNNLRSRNGKEYFSRLDLSSSINFYNQRMQLPDLQIAVGIVSIKRTAANDKFGAGYLYQSASAIDKLLKNDFVMNNKITTFAFVCNVDLYPKRHEIAQDISKFMPFSERYGDNSIGLTNLKVPGSNYSFKHFDRHKDVFEKETYDYVYCMNAAASLNPRYVLLIEEDAIPHKDFTRVLDYLLSFNTKTNLNHPLPAFWKFYFPSKWQGFSLRFEEIADLISFSCLGAFLVCLLLYFYQLKKPQRTFHYSPYTLFLTSFIISLFSCYIIGRQNLNELRRLSPQLYRIQSSEMCCTQAMLYPIEIVPRLSKYMITAVLTAHTDLLIRDFSDIEKLPSYQIEPNLFYHTGIHSTLPHDQKHPEEFIFSDFQL